ncbi:MAG: J domain-containing protein [Cytophagales bacterium]|nr:J domain-containing protein [Cytophagales bacterium]MDW8385029.1 J domain-containing protein [Flammeovirgaceae bacterium]
MVWERIKYLISSEIHSFRKLNDSDFVDWERIIKNLDEEEKALKNRRNTKSPAYSELELAYYRYLEVFPGAPFEIIKKQYKTLIKQYHPDKISGTKEREYAHMRCKQLNEAYEYFEKKFDVKKC